MKVAITGHSSGIGKALSDVFDNFIGFSRSNGYDISLESSRQQIIKESNDCDVFINNAYSEYGQQFMLYDIWEHWKLKKKIILNIGSRAADYVHNRNYTNYRYSIQKQALESASMYMTHCMMPCKVVCIKPGYVDTPSIENVPNPKIKPAELANFIKSLINNENLTMWVPVVTIYPR